MIRSMSVCLRGLRKRIETMPTNEEIEQFKKKIEIAIKSNDFLSLVGYLTESEQQVLYELIYHNQAMPLKTLRDEVVMTLFNRFMEARLSDGTTSVKKLGLPDSSVKKGTEFVKQAERLLRSNGIRVPSLNIIKSAVNNLTHLEPPLVEERPVFSKKVKVLYAISPTVYKVWQEQDKEVSNELNKRIFNKRLNWG